jgi:hypothetical protein
MLYLEAKTKGVSSFDYLADNLAAFCEAVLLCWVRRE